MYKGECEDMCWQVRSKFDILCSTKPFWLFSFLLTVCMPSQISARWCEAILYLKNRTVQRPFEAFWHSSVGQLWWEMGQFFYATTGNRSCTMLIHKSWKRVRKNFDVMALTLELEPDDLVLPSLKSQNQAGSSRSQELQDRATHVWQIRTKGALMLMLVFYKHKRGNDNKALAHALLVGFLRAVRVVSLWQPGDVLSMMEDNEH